MRKQDIELLQKIADLCEQASNEIHTETEEEEDILSTCDELLDKIDEYLEEN